jgi:hypothetical protein
MWPWAMQQVPLWVTRWNSTFLLLDWILDYKIELTEFLNSNFRDASLDIRHKLIHLGFSHPQGIEMARDSDLCFTKIEWEIISLKRDILKPFMVFTEGFNQSTSTSSEALICYFYLYDYLKDLEQCSAKELTKSTFDKHGICAERTGLPFGLRVAAGKAFKKLDGYMKRMDLVDMVYLSNVLNPRYKTIYLRANMERADCDNILQMCKDKVIKIDEILMKDMVRDTEHNTDQDTVSSNRMPSAFEKIISSCLPESERLTPNIANQEAYDSISGEWESYLNTDRSVNSTNDLLGYWKRHSKLYPRLAAVARVVYGFSSTSTSCERSFSLARNVIGHRRHRLAPLTLERMISSNFNFKVMKRSGMDVSAIFPITTHITEEDLEVSQIGTVESQILTFSRNRSYIVSLRYKFVLYIMPILGKLGPIHDGYP